MPEKLSKISHGLNAQAPRMSRIFPDPLGSVGTSYLGEADLPRKISGTLNTGIGYAWMQPVGWLGDPKTVALQ